MWLQPESSAVFSRRAVLATVTVVGLSVLTGCGFKPLYGVTQDGSAVSSELSYVTNPEPRHLLAQLIRHHLLSTMSPAGGPVGDRYRREYDIKTSSNDLVVQQNTDVARRQYRLSVDYRLIDSKSNKELHRGRTFSHLAYDRVESEFSNLQAETDVRERAANQVADDIRTRLAAYFSSI